MIENGSAEDGPDHRRVAEIHAARKRQRSAFADAPADDADALAAYRERRPSASAADAAAMEAPRGAPTSAMRRSQIQALESRPIAIPLPAAMSYCARHVLDALNGRGDANGHAALNALSASTRELLSWWFADAACRRRSRNFHVGQREAILQTVLAHELFRTDDPHRLFREACGAWPSASDATPSPASFASYRLRMAPGSGVRWVVQALWLWQWAGAAEDRALVRRETCFDSRATVLAGDPAAAERFAEAIFGPRGVDGVRAPALGGFARAADVFLPPRLRDGLLRALASYAVDEANAPLRIAAFDERDASRRRRTITPLRLVIGDGAHQYAPSIGIATTLAVSARDRFSDASRDCLRDAPARMLWLEFDDGVDDPPADAAVLTDLPFARAMRIGASKSVLLVEANDGAPEKARSTRTHARRGRRPVLPCRHRPPLDAGLRLLERIERETAALRAVDADTAPPALLVLCEDPHWHRAVRAYARARGVGDVALCDEDDVGRQRSARMIVDTLPPMRAAMQPRFCAVVVLRESGAEVFDALDAGRLLAPALPPRWRDDAFAESKAEYRECIADGRAPGGLLDMLPAIAAHWPMPIEGGGRGGVSLPLLRIADLPPAAGDLRVIGLRKAHNDFDFALPDPAAAHGAASRLLSSLAHRTMRARHSMPVRKCVYTHQGWSKRSDGMERGLIEMAEDDPCIAAFCLFDAARHPWPAASDPPPACPHALVRTAGYVYAVQYAPALPVRAASEAEPPGVRAARDAMAAWCRRVNALPAGRRQYREWRPVQVQAPLFWSWKRRGGTLSSLLSALAETTPITAQRPRLAQPFEDVGPA